MTKKISCRIIDSTALSQDEPDLHLGWCLDTSIYSQSDQPQAKFTPRRPTREPHTNPNPFGKNLDCYA